MNNYLIDADNGVVLEDFSDVLRCACPYCGILLDWDFTKVYNEEYEQNVLVGQEKCCGHDFEIIHKIIDGNTLFFVYNWKE